MWKPASSSAASPADTSSLPLLAVLNADGKGKICRTKQFVAASGVARRHQPANVCIAYLHQLSGCGAGTEHHRIAESARHPRDGGRALNQEEVDALKIQAVPSVYANGKLLHVGRGSLGELCRSWKKPSAVLRKRTKHR